MFWLSQSLQSSLVHLLEGAILLGLIYSIKCPAHWSLNTIEVPIISGEMIPAGVGNAPNITKPSPRTPLQSVRVVTKGKISNDWSTLGHWQNQLLAHKRRQDGGVGRKNSQNTDSRVKEGEQLLGEQLPDLSTTVMAIPGRLGGSQEER